ncbi:MAG: DUF1893 domain-containing protein [Bacillota bacterium]|nr:DUF1893 domain-containing protein [Bacillota bacterium]
MSCTTRRCRIEGDIQLARSLLRNGDLGLVAVKDGKVVASSRERGVRPLLHAVLGAGKGLEGAVVGDRVVGRASAMLCIYCDAGAVYTPLASEGALLELRSARIPVVAEATTSAILNRDGTDRCPFEKMTDGLGSPAEVVAALRTFFESRK